MPTEEAQKTSQEPQTTKQESKKESEKEIDYSKEIEIAEGIKKQALDHYKRESVDTWNIQHSIIRNYLWLSLTFIAGYCAIFNKAFELSPLDDYCPIFVLVIAFILALIALVIGISAMTGASSLEPDENYVEFLKYLTQDKYDQGNHYALLSKEITTLKRVIEEEQNETHKRGTAMRQMNSLLKGSIAFASLSAILFLLTTLFS